MNANGSPPYSIKTRDPAQSQLWRRLFDTAILPVRCPFPHETFYQDGGSARVYVLDSRRMALPQLHRLASYLQARTWGLTYAAALAQTRDGWTIAADQCELVKTAVTEESERPFALSFWNKLWPTHDSSFV